MVGVWLVRNHYTRNPVNSNCDGSILQSVLDKTTDIGLAIDNSVKTVNGESKQELVSLI